MPTQPEVSAATNEPIPGAAKSGTHVLGIGVWPHGRRPARIEDNRSGWTVIVGEGTMLIERQAFNFALRDLFGGCLHGRLRDWAELRGFVATVHRGEDGWELELPETFSVFGLIVLKTWWRSLGRNPVETALGRLTSEDSSPIWLLG